MPSDWKNKLKDFLIYYGSAFIVTIVRYKLQYGHIIEFDWRLPFIVVLHLVFMVVVGGTCMSIANRQLKIDIKIEKLFKQVCLFTMYAAIAILIVSNWPEPDPFSD
jgi:hypothetical protein